VQASFIGTERGITESPDAMCIESAFKGVQDSVYPHSKTKTAENTIAKLGTGIVHHDASPINDY